MFSKENSIVRRVENQDFLVFYLGLFLLLLPLLFERIVDWTGALFYVGDHKMWFRHLFKELISNAATFTIVYVPSVFLSRWTKKMYKFLLLFFTSFTCLFALSHWLIYGIPLNNQARLTILLSDLNENFQFVQQDQNMLVLSVVLLLSVGLSYFALSKKWEPKFLQQKRAKRIAQAIQIVALLFLIVQPSWFYLESSEWGKYFKTHQEHKVFVKEMEDFRIDPTLANDSSAKDLNAHIVVVGESVSRHHMSLYGYGRPTNPLLLENEHITIIDGISTENVHTEGSLKEVFFPKKGEGRVSLIDVLRAQGYRCVWISNQAALGYNEKVATIAASRCDTAIFLRGAGGDRLDEALLPVIKNIMDDDQAQIIFVHMMGSHQEYGDRYPEEHQYFKANRKFVFGRNAGEQVAHYDNSIRYLDWFLTELFHLVQNHNEDSDRDFQSIVYFSDHGDEVYDFRDFKGHHQGKTSKYMKDVPFLVFNPNGIGSFLRAKDGKLSNVSTYLLTLFKYGGVFEDSPGFEKDWSKYESHASVDSFSVNLWAHRVNSIDRYHELASSYNGFELDIMVEDSALEVNHPPAKSIGLSFENFLDSCDRPNNSYWLDFKNLKEENLLQTVQFLVAMDDTFKLKERIILESNQIVALKEFSKRGFKTSYYLNKQDYNHVDSLKDQLQEGEIWAVSQSIEYLSMMQDSFPDQKHLTWALRAEIEDKDQWEEIVFQLRNFGNVEVCLLNHPTPSWR